MWYVPTVAINGFSCPSLNGPRFPPYPQLPLLRNSSRMVSEDIHPGHRCLFHTTRETCGQVRGACRPQYVVLRKCRILLDFDKSKIHPVCSTFTETVQAIRTLSKVACLSALICFFSSFSILWMTRFLWISLSPLSMLSSCWKMT